MSSLFYEIGKGMLTGEVANLACEGEEYPRLAANF